MRHHIITISREYASGGHTIGQELAKRLGCHYYDKEMIELTARESGFNEEYIRNVEQNVTSSFLYNLGLGGAYAASALSQAGAPRLSAEDQVFVTQSRIIKQLADSSEPAIIIGRLGNYVLRERDDVLHVYIYGSVEDRLERAIRVYGLTREEAEKELKRRDKARASQYRHYTDHSRGLAQDYDICLNSGKLGLSTCVAILEEHA